MKWAAYQTLDLPSNKALNNIITIQEANVIFLSSICFLWLYTNGKRSKSNERAGYVSKACKQNKTEYPKQNTKPWKDKQKRALS